MQSEGSGPQIAGEPAAEAPIAPLPGPEVPPPAPARPRDPDLRWLLWWTAVGFALRAAHELWIHPVSADLSSDMGFSFETARAFANPHHVLDKWDVVKPRAMGLVGAAILRAFGSGALGKWMWGLLQVVLSAATPPLAFLGARRAFGRRSARIALVILALDPLAIAYVGFLMVETYAMASLALAFALLDPERPLLALASGLAVGTAGLFKPQVLLLVPLWCLMLFFWPALRSGLRAWLVERRRLAAILLGAGVLAVVAPEAVTVSKLVGHPTLLSAYSGQNFYIGHCNVWLMSMLGTDPGDRPYSFGVPKVFQRNEPFPDVTFRVSILDSGFFIQEGMKCWRRSFWGTVVWSLEQLADVFAGWPGSTIDPFPIPGGWNQLPRYYSVILEYFLVPLGFVEWWRRRRELGSWLAFLAPMGSIWALALVFSGDPRYREPFDVFLVSGAAGGLARLWDRHRGAVLSWAVARLSRLRVAAPVDQYPQD